MTESTPSSSVDSQMNNLGLSENPDLIPQNIHANDTIQVQIKNTFIEESEFCNKENLDISRESIVN